MSEVIKIALIGLGKIAKAQHLPALMANPDFEIVATVDPFSKAEQWPHFTDIEALLESPIACDAIAILTPPQMRFDIAQKAIRAGKHVLLEKPPAAALGEAQALVNMAQTTHHTLFCAWHSRFAAQVVAFKQKLAAESITQIDIVWKEDAQKWHPGQNWILQAGGMGVFDPAINALSILTSVWPESIFATKANFLVPENCQSPIAATVEMSTVSRLKITGDFDFRQKTGETWTIRATCSSGKTIEITHGGSQLWEGETLVAKGTDEEYPRLYVTFADLIRNGQSDADLAPLRLVSDAFFLSERRATEAFHI